MSEEKKIDPFSDGWKYELILGHTVIKHLERYYQFYDSLSDLIIGRSHIFLEDKLLSLIGVDTYILSSIGSTIESISEVLKKGHLGDAYALLRKYHDSVIINIYLNILEQEKSFGLNEKANKWVKGEEKIPSYGTMLKHIRCYKNLEPICKILFEEDNRYDKIRRKCNDFIHCNSLSHMSINDRESLIKHLEKLYDQFFTDFTAIFILHFSCYFYINDHYMASTNYVDWLECGLKPEVDSQYWVAPGVQKIFDDVIKKYRMDLAKEIVHHTCMHLEL